MTADESVVVSAPTGSGKTVVFELAIVNLLFKIHKSNYNQHFLIVYMAPMKALCSERAKDWKNKFSPLGLVCEEVTGDTDRTLSDISTFNIVLTTPEKWDSLTRAWKDNETIVQTVKLFLLDEVHILNDEKRGPVLEAVVSRMKTIEKNLSHSSHQETSPGHKLLLSIRFIAVSATIPNVEDVASWLGGTDQPAKYFKIGEEFRPVKLNKVVLGYPCSAGTSLFRFELTLNYKLRNILFRYSEGKPSLIFCSTRKGVMQAADTLQKQITFHFTEEQKILLNTALINIKENAVKRSLLAGIGCHHAGMDIQDRRTIEDLFRREGLPVLITTSTLAMGVNLPAHLVIIKSTQQYTSHGYQEYSTNQILQMIGRAGRPQFDTSATAVIMTKEERVHKYQKLVSGTDILESSLHRHLTEHLNSEIVLSTITKQEVAINWVRSTFLYVRALRNPTHYGISANLSKRKIESKLQEMCMIVMNGLASYNIVKMDMLGVRSTDIGKLMAQHYMSFETMKSFTKISGKENLSDILKIISRCNEFEDCKLRTSEKKSLNFLNTSIRFPLSGLIKTPEMKINCLVQAMFGGLMIQDPSLQQESVQIVRTGSRVTRFLTRYLSLQDKFQSLLSATILEKCFQSNLWENSPYVSRQLAGIGAVLSQLLVSAEKVSFQAIAESNPRDLERIINRAPPMGNRIQEAALHMPQYSIEVSETSVQSSTQYTLRVRLINYEVIQSFSTPGFHHSLVLIVGDSNNKILLYTRFQDALLINHGGSYSWLIEVETSLLNKLFVHLISEKWVGMDQKICIDPKSIEDAPHVNRSLEKQNVYSEKGRKAVENKKQEKKKDTPVLRQLEKASSNLMNTMGTKNLSLSVEKRCSQVNIKDFLFTPRKKEKLTQSSNKKLQQKKNLSSLNILTKYFKEKKNICPENSVQLQDQSFSKIANAFEVESVGLNLKLSNTEKIALEKEQHNESLKLFPIFQSNIQAASSKELLTSLTAEESITLYEIDASKRYHNQMQDISLSGCDTELVKDKKYVDMNKLFSNSSDKLRRNPGILEYENDSFSSTATHSIMCTENLGEEQETCQTNDEIRLFTSLEVDSPSSISSLATVVFPVSEQNPDDRYQEKEENELHFESASSQQLCGKPELSSICQTTETDGILENHGKDRRLVQQYKTLECTTITNESIIKPSLNNNSTKYLSKFNFLRSSSQQNLKSQRTDNNYESSDQADRTTNNGNTSTTSITDQTNNTNKENFCDKLKEAGKNSDTLPFPASEITPFPVDQHVMPQELLQTETKENPVIAPTTEKLNTSHQSKQGTDKTGRSLQGNFKNQTSSEQLSTQNFSSGSNYGLSINNINMKYTPIFQKALSDNFPMYFPISDGNTGKNDDEYSENSNNSSSVKEPAILEVNFDLGIDALLETSEEEEEDGEVANVKKKNEKFSNPVYTKYLELKAKWKPNVDFSNPVNRLLYGGLNKPLSPHRKQYLLWRGRNIFHKQEVEPHRDSSQEDTIAWKYEQLAAGVGCSSSDMQQNEKFENNFAPLPPLKKANLSDYTNNLENNFQRLKEETAFTLPPLVTSGPYQVRRNPLDAFEYLQSINQENNDSPFQQLFIKESANEDEEDIFANL